MGEERLPVRRKQQKRITERDKEVFLEGVRQGMTMRAAAEAAAHPPDTFYKLRYRDPDFEEEVQLAKRIGTDVIEEEAQRRGVEGFKRPVYGKVAPGIDGVIGEEIVYSDKLLEVLLKGRRPEYRDNPRVDITNQTLVVNAEDRSAALSEVAKVLAEAGVQIGQNSGRGAGEVVSDPSLLLAESEDV